MLFVHFFWAFTSYFLSIKFRKLLWNNPSVYCANICHYDWFNKHVDWPIAEQDKHRQESQTDNDGMRKGGVSRIARQTKNESDTQNGIEVKAIRFGAAQRLTEMG